MDDKNGQQQGLIYRDRSMIHGVKPAVFILPAICYFGIHYISCHLYHVIYSATMDIWPLQILQAKQDESQEVVGLRSRGDDEGRILVG